MKRGYQFNFSTQNSEMFNTESREKKAKTMVIILEECSQRPLSEQKVLNVGGSSGIIDNSLSKHFDEVVSIDIDEKAINYAKSKFRKNNLHFEVGDAMNLKYDSNSFDIIICSQVYEHVSDSTILMNELYRVVKPGGLVYFAAGNRYCIMEPHYNLPLLSALPRPIAHKYLKLMRGLPFYYEKHYSYWGLKKLTQKFKSIDFTVEMLNKPQKYEIEYMIQPHSIKHKIAMLVAKKFYWLVPTYIWILKKA